MAGTHDHWERRRREELVERAAKAGIAPDGAARMIGIQVPAHLADSAREGRYEVQWDSERFGTLFPDCCEAPVPGWRLLQVGRRRRQATPALRAFQALLDECERGRQTTSALRRQV